MEDGGPADSGNRVRRAGTHAARKRGSRQAGGRDDGCCGGGGIVAAVEDAERGSSEC